MYTHIQDLSEELPGCTSPLLHQGRFYDRVLKVEESVFAVCPPKRELKPSYVLIFELFMCKSKFAPSDSLVAWGALPMCNEHFAVVKKNIDLNFILFYFILYINYFILIFQIYII